MTKTAAPNDAVLPPGSLILITGATAYIGAHIADQLLQRGYRIRGVVRDQAKAQWLNDRFDRDYGKGAYESTTARDLGAPGALKDAMADADGVIHVASIATFSADYASVVPPVVSFATNALESALATPRIKRFVHTSSSWAAAFPVPVNDPNFHIGQSTYNDNAVRIAQNPPNPADPALGATVYAASKVLSERAVWDLATRNREKRPDLVINTVLPDFNTGAPLSWQDQGFPSTAGLLKALFDGNAGVGQHMIPPQHFVDVVDTARLHVAGLLHPDVRGERIFAYAEPKNGNGALKIFRDKYPHRKFLDDLPGEGEDLTVVEGKERARELLKWLGRDGFVGQVESYTQLMDIVDQNDVKDAGWLPAAA